MLDLGGIYPAALPSLTDASGNPANVTTIALTITLPDGTPVPCTVTNPPAVTGQYVFSFSTTEPGRHLVRWTIANATPVFFGTVSLPAAAYTDVFDVAEQAPPAIFSLASAKRQLGISASNTSDDDELREKVVAITRSMENFVHEVICPRVFNEEHQYGGAGTYFFAGNLWPYSAQLRLYRVPVIQIQSIVASDFSTSWDPANFDPDPDTGLFTVIKGPPLAGHVRVIYLAGYQVIPYNYIEAAKVLLQHVWESRRGPGGASGVIGPEELADYRHFTAMPRKAQEWLGPARPVVA